MHLLRANCHNKRFIKTSHPNPFQGQFTTGPKTPSKNPDLEIPRYERERPKPTLNHWECVPRLRMVTNSCTEVGFFLDLAFLTCCMLIASSIISPFEKENEIP